VHAGDVEQGVSPSAPARARATRRVVHVEVFWSSECLVASDPEGLDTFIPGPPRRPLTSTGPRSDPKSRVRPLITMKGR
jgi:hypothetical protein